MASQSALAPARCPFGGQAPQSVISLAPLLLLPFAAWLLANPLAPWLLMWALSIAIYAGLKWLTWRRARQAAPSTSAFRSYGYLLLWPGMDAPRFFNGQRRVRTPARKEALASLGTLVLGVALLWFVARLALPRSPLLGGWIGLVGLALMLHFGAFRLFSLVWRRLGIDANPLMHAPVLASSVADLWANRWNTAFHVLARDFVVAPLRRRVGVPAAIMLAFLASGLVHDLVISLPARAGFGLPTAYFLIQGSALLAERSTTGRRLGLGHGIRGRIFALAVAGLPAFVLFHPPFISTVVLPFMRFMGAL